MGAMNAEEMKNYKGVFVFAQQVDVKWYFFRAYRRRKETGREA